MLEEQRVLVEKRRDQEKREREETKRLEKAVFKKDLNEVEEVYRAGNAKKLYDRIAKTINEGVLKQWRALEKTRASHELMEAQVAKAQKDFESALKKKQMLKNLCKDLLDKNYELYLKHE